MCRRLFPGVVVVGSGDGMKGMRSEKTLHVLWGRIGESVVCM